MRCRAALVSPGRTPPATGNEGDIPKGEREESTVDQEAAGSYCTTTVPAIPWPPGAPWYRQW